MLKLYDYPGAPNPRRVKIFLAEKGIEYETVHCDITKLEQKQDAFLKMNPSGKIPVLELEDGRHLGESVAICRYLEAICPAPNLFGEDPFELGHIEMRNRQIELELWSQVGCESAGSADYRSIDPGRTHLAPELQLNLAIAHFYMA